MPFPFAHLCRMSDGGVQVGVCLVTTRNDVTVDDLRKELRPIVAAYKLPRRLKLFEAEIPRNVSVTPGKAIDSLPRTEHGQSQQKATCHRRLSIGGYCITIGTIKKCGSQRVGPTMRSITLCTTKCSGNTGRHPYGLANPPYRYFATSRFHPADSLPALDVVIHVLLTALRKNRIPPRCT